MFKTHRDSFFSRRGVIIIALAWLIGIGSGNIRMYVQNRRIAKYEPPLN